MKLIPEDLSNVASDGMLGRRHPETARKDRGTVRLTTMGDSIRTTIHKSASIE